MEGAEFEAQLRDSAYLRRALADLLQSTEQALSIVAAAAARQGDRSRFAADLLDLQQRAAMQQTNPVRDRLLGAVRERIQAERT